MTGMTSPPLVCGGSGDHTRRQRITGWSFLALAPLLQLQVAVMTGLLLYLEWDSYRYRGFSPVFTSCSLILPVSLWVLFGLYLWVVAALLHNAHRLAHLRLRIDGGGITVDDQLLPWPQIRHIAVTRARIPGQRMLLIDAGTGAEADHTDVEQGGRATWRRVFGIRRFSVELPLESLDVEPADLLHAIRHHSAGRFPDLNTRAAPTSRVPNFTHPGSRGGSQTRW